MDNLQTLTAFVGWCSIINLVILGGASILLSLMRDAITSLHGEVFGVSKEEMFRAYVQYLSTCKILVIVLNFVPYIALKTISCSPAPSSLAYKCLAASL